MLLKAETFYKSLEKNLHSFFFFADQLPCETLGNNYKYILDNCYYIEATPHDFTKASENCKDRFGDLGIGRLFEPKTQISNDAVIQEARKTVTTTHIFWMGIRDSDSKNNWQYVSSNQTISWTNWHSGFPDNYLGNPENCVNTVIADSFQWNDESCTRSSPSICELTTDMAV